MATASFRARRNHATLCPSVEHWLTCHVSGGDQQIPTSHRRRRAASRTAIRQKRGSRCGAQAGDLEPQVRGEGRLRIPQLRDQDGRPHPGGEHRPDEGGAEVRCRQGHPPHLLCGVVDPRLHPELHPEELEPGEARDHAGAAQAVLLARAHPARVGEVRRRHRGHAEGQRGRHRQEAAREARRSAGDAAADGRPRPLARRSDGRGRRFLPRGLRDARRRDGVERPRQWYPRAMRRVAGLPPVYWWLWLGYLLSSLGTFVFPFLALYLSSRGIDARQTGLVLSLLGVGAVLAGPIGGQIADRGGRKPPLLLAPAFSAASALYLGFVRSPLAVAPRVLAFGLGVSMARPAMQAIVADVLPPDLLGRAFALLYWATNVGIAFSAWIGGVLAGRTWLGLFAGDALTTVLFAALVVFRVPESRPLPASGGRAVGWTALVGDRPLLAFLATHFAFMIVFWQFQFALPLAVVGSGFGTREYGRLMALNCAAVFVTQPFTARWLRSIAGSCWRSPPSASGWDSARMRSAPTCRSSTLPRWSGRSATWWGCRSSARSWRP